MRCWWYISCKNIPDTLRALSVFCSDYEWPNSWVIECGTFCLKVDLILQTILLYDSSHWFFFPHFHLHDVCRFNYCLNRPNKPIFVVEPIYCWHVNVDIAAASFECQIKAAITPLQGTCEIKLITATTSVASEPRINTTFICFFY